MTAQKRGQLRIFFGYAPGVGKTCIMLREAIREKERGVDVVIGHLASDITEEARQLSEDLERLSPGPEGEFDLDGAMVRRPQLILVDRLAHQNGRSSRHTRRYQDVEELLRAGIDVYTILTEQTGWILWIWIPRLFMRPRDRKRRRSWRFLESLP